MKVATWQGEAKFTIDEVPMPKLKQATIKLSEIAYPLS